MSIDEFLRYFQDYKATDAQLAAARFLEWHTDKKFLVDFGFENAMAIVDVLLADLETEYIQ